MTTTAVSDRSWASALVAIIAATATALMLLPPVAAHSGEVAEDQPEPLGLPEACDGMDPDPFDDVDPAGTHGPGIACVAHLGITLGVEPGLYGPGQQVLRDQMATFLARLIDEADLRELPDAGQVEFHDEGDERAEVHRENAERLAEAGIVGGVDEIGGQPVYGFLDPVNRAAMASFLIRSAEWAAETELEVPAEHPFDDVDDGDTHAENIAKAWLAGVAGGVAADTYDQWSGLTRAQMGTFLSRAFALLEDTEPPQTMTVTSGSLAFFEEPPEGSISGAVNLDGDPAGEDEVDVELSGDAAATTTTDADGEYAFEDLLPGSYTVTVQDADEIFDPVSADFEVAHAEDVRADFALVDDPASVSGAVTVDGGPAGAGEVTVELSGDAVTRTTTDGNGDYELSDLAPGDYVVTATHPEYESVDANVDGLAVGEDREDVDLALTESTDPADEGPAFEFSFPECPDGEPAPDEELDCIVFAGEHDGEGNLEFPAEHVSFPQIEETLEDPIGTGQDLVLLVQIVAGEDATVTVDPATGEAVADVVLDVQVEDDGGLLDPGCQMTGIDMDPTTGVSGLLEGTDYQAGPETAGFVDGQFTVDEIPAGVCTALGGAMDVGDLLNDELSLPSEPGQVELKMDVLFDPELGLDVEPDPGLTVTVTSGQMDIYDEGAEPGDDPEMGFAFPECPDGEPADPDLGCIVYEGAYDDGTLSFDEEDITFPVIEEPVDISGDGDPDFTLLVFISAPGGATGTLDGGALDMEHDLLIDVHHDEGGIWHLDDQDDPHEGCPLDGISLEPTSGQSGDLTGVDYDDADGTATLVENELVIPAVEPEFCYLGEDFGNTDTALDIGGLVNNELSLPTDPGQVELTLDVLFDPVI